MNRFDSTLFIVFLSSSAALAVPGKPAILSPVPDDYPERRPLFHWTVSDNAVLYKLQLLKGGQPFFETQTEQTTFTPRADLPPGTYDVQVAGFDGALYGAWSDPVRFRRVFTPYLSSINGMSEDGGNIDLVAGSGISLALDPTNLTVTLAASVTAGEIVNGAVVSAKLAAGSVTPDKIADGAVTTSKLADSSVTSLKVANGTLLNADLAANAGIADTKLAAITTAGKVANSATTATAANNANAIVARNGTGGFNAGLISAAFSGNGSALYSLNADQLVSGTVSVARLPSFMARTSQVWLLGGNAGTAPGTHYLGTSDAMSMALKVNGARALKLEYTGGSPNILGGWNGNITYGVVQGGTISGGGGSAGILQLGSSFATIGGGFDHCIWPNSEGATISGGQQNRIWSNAPNAFIGGGAANMISTDINCPVIVGGYNNKLETYASSSAIGGGYNNTIKAHSMSSVISGGESNIVYAFNNYSVICGGLYNSGTGRYSTVAGGYDNLAGENAFAAGSHARATHKGTFVWGDSGSATVSSITSNSVTLRAAGGYRLFTNARTNAGVSLASGATAWGVISDRNLKKDFQPVDGQAVLDTLGSIPITKWRYTWESEDETPHIGPVAQDFIPAFYPGREDTRITTLEADGVALAAIQGLNQRVKDLQQENADLKIRLDRLERKLER